MKQSNFETIKVVKTVLKNDEKMMKSVLRLLEENRPYSVIPGFNREMAEPY